jgi:hypothetical protein
MEITEAITILQIESANIGVNIGKESNLMKVILLATSQLQGTLATQNTELEDTKIKLEEATVQVIDLQTQLVPTKPLQ